jgi:hypothetical protein
VKESFFHIPVLEDMQVNCVAQHLSDEAQTWWATVKERRIEERCFLRLILNISLRFDTTQHNINGIRSKSF